MSSPSPPLHSHAKALALPTACLLRQRARHHLVRGWSGAAVSSTKPLVGAAASSGLSGCYHYSVAAAPTPTASSSSISPRRAGAGGGLVALTFTASVVVVSVFLTSFSVIRSMLACKKEAEFLEKYFDAVREKLPETMASVRLVGREVSDLAVDLTDLSQELAKVVKSSMNIVHTAEAQLRRLTPSAQPGTARRMSNQNKVEEPLLASTVRDLRELLADIRSGFGAASGITGLFMWASSFVLKSRKNHS